MAGANFVPGEEEFNDDDFAFGNDDYGGDFGNDDDEGEFGAPQPNTAKRRTAIDTLEALAKSAASIGTPAPTLTKAADLFAMPTPTSAKATASIGMPTPTPTKTAALFGVPAPTTAKATAVTVSAAAIEVTKPTPPKKRSYVKRGHADAAAKKTAKAAYDKRPDVLEKKRLKQKEKRRVAREEAKQQDQ